jgi:hypothetical protein
MQQATKAVSPLRRVDELRAKEAQAKAAYEKKAVQVAGLQERKDHPLAADTQESLNAIDQDLGIASRDLVLLKRDYEIAASVRAQAEENEAAEQNARQRQDLQRRLDEAVKVMPDEYRRNSQKLVSLVTMVHELDREIDDFNKRQPPGSDRLATFEQHVRWPDRNEKGVVPFIPVKLADEFEIAPLQRGDNFRVPGTVRPGGGMLSIWHDANGVPRR